VFRESVDQGYCRGGDQGLWGERESLVMGQLKGGDPLG